MTVVSPALQCGEGAIWDTARSRFLLTDAMGRQVFEISENAKRPSPICEERQVGSIALHRGGGLVLGGAEGVWVKEPDGTEHWLAREADGVPVQRINEVLADPAGRVFAAQEVFAEEGGYAPGYLFRFDPDGRAVIAEEGIHIGNGMAFSPDRRTFYFTDSLKRTIFAYDYREADGSLRHRRAAVKVPAKRGLPDGLAVDAQGFLWTARWFGGGVARYDPQGRLERFLSVPATQVSSVAFGGRDLTTLLITSAAVHWKTRLAPVGHDFTLPRGGETFRCRQEIVGQAECLAAV